MSGLRPSVAATLKLMRSEVTADSPILAAELLPVPSRGEAGFSQLLSPADTEPAAATTVQSYALALEYIFEGYLLHYDESRLLQAGEPGLNLLAGDYMFAKGLGYIASQQDLFSIRLLADLISLCSLLHSRSQAVETVLTLWSAVSLSLSQQLGKGDGNMGSSQATGRQPFPADAWLDAINAAQLNEMVVSLLSVESAGRRQQLESELVKIYACFS